MKKMFAVIAIMFAICNYIHADELDTKLDKLKNDQDKLAVEMYNVRVDLIKNDPELNKLHKKIMAMHKELAIKIDNKQKMQALLKKKDQIEFERQRILREKRKQQYDKEKNK